MNKYIVQIDDERLDEIVFKHYKDLSLIDEVLAENKKVPVFFKHGDVVNLPEIKEKVKENVLW